jgi:hypothetical protein
MVQALDQQFEQVMEQEFDGFAPALRWEPCPEPSAPDGLGLCAACGWLFDDHAASDDVRGDGGRAVPDGRVVAIPVRQRPRLRRAS